MSGDSRSRRCARGLRAFDRGERDGRVVRRDRRHGTRRWRGDIGDGIRERGTRGQRIGAEIVVLRRGLVAGRIARVMHRAVIVHRMVAPMRIIGRLSLPVCAVLGATVGGFSYLTSEHSFPRWRNWY